jgi:hypothetical protein
MTIIRKALPFVVFGCTQLAHADTERRDVDGFTDIGVSTGIDVILRQGANFSVEVETDDDIDELLTEVVDDTLRIYWERGNWLTFGLLDWFDDNEASVTVTLPVLERVVTSGGAEVYGEGTFTGNNLVIRTSGGGGVRLDIAMDDVEASTSGGSDIRVTVVDSLTARASGGSDISYEGDPQDRDIDSSGGADIRHR